MTFLPNIDLAMDMQEDYLAAQNTTTENIFGFTWLGNWSASDPTDPDARAAKAFIDRWVEKIDSGGMTPELALELFEKDLYAQTWFKDKNNAWQAIQKMRFGTEGAPGEWDTLLESTRLFVENALRQLGFVNNRGDLIVEVDNAFLENLIYEASSTPYGDGTISLDANKANRILENKFIDTRSFDSQEGSLQVGSGSLKDLFNQINGIATANFVSIPEEDVWDMVSRVRREEMTIQSVYDMVTDRVGDQYDFLTTKPIYDRIKGTAFNPENPAGFSSLSSHLEPVRSSIASTWGLSSSEIDLSKEFGPNLDGLIIGEGADQRFMNSREAKNWARLQPRFKESHEYKTSMGNITRELLRTFGAI
jgi:hypothetical protein